MTSLVQALCTIAAYGGTAGGLIGDELFPGVTTMNEFAVVLWMGALIFCILSLITDSLRLIWQRRQ